MLNTVILMMGLLSRVWIAEILPVKDASSSLPERVAVIQDPALKEASSLTQSLRVPGRFWSLNDSGNSPDLYPLDVAGRALSAPVVIEGAVNRDWEALTVDGEGGLWIGDFGNNLNQRKDLTIYRVDEPGEEIPASIPVTRILKFRYSDQQAFPPEKLNFDCEAMFVWEKRIYLLTKHQADANTSLYRIDNLESEEMQTARLVEPFPMIGLVTDAALRTDGKQLAVLTYSGIWVFERSDENGDSFLQGPGKHLKFRNWALRQVEGLTWLDAHTLLICNEQRSLFRVRVDGKGWVAFKGRSAVSADESP